MYIPKVTIVEVKTTYIYIKNILKWTESDPEIKKIREIPFEELVVSMDNLMDSFRLVFDKKQVFILKRISEISGYSWSAEQPVIQVYPTPFFSSFSHPLFLRVCRVNKGKIIPRNFGNILGVLIHELGHINFGGAAWDNRDLSEGLLNFIAQSILEEVDRTYTKEWLDFFEMIKKDTNISLVPKAIRDGEITVKDFYSK